MATSNNSKPATAAEIISQHDKQVLDLIFNSSNELTLDALLPPASNSNEQVSTEDVAVPAPKQHAIPEEELAKLKAMEIEGVRLAEADNYPGAIERLTEVVTLCPRYASVYNNRAQVYRLVGDMDRALEDLNLAIEHANNDATVLRQAYTQRGIIHKARGDTDAAFRDFERGGRHGSAIAKEAAVHENPYAKMCNAIVMEAMNKLKTPQQ
ncbi:hypothetical protein BDF19DRAFT_453183 [Syncephalis fuscata]|nr:hypothetical protein BDF19DRAFT_453183 [Syncephalis fuscata]